MIRRFPKFIGLCLLLDLVLTTPASHLEFYKIGITQQIERNRLYIFMRSEGLSLPGFSQALVSLPRLLGAGPVARSLKSQTSKLRGTSEREGVCSMSDPARVRRSTGRGVQGVVP